MFRILVALAGVLALVACGGVATSPSTPAVNGPNSGTPASNPIPSPAVVNVAAGQSSAGVDITVVSPASSAAPNAQDLGVNPMSGTATASNSGGMIHRASTQRVVMFGPGLTGDMTVTVRGNDITAIMLQAIAATDGTPGVQFIVTVDPTATLGARTVVLSRPNGDITTFTGGLEVVP